MASWGKVDYKELKELEKRLSKVTQKRLDEFYEACAKELAARLLAKVIKRTPVGKYPKGSGKVGGTLRRGWTGSANGKAAAYAASLQVHHSGRQYTVEIIDPVEYASYVEYGHRTRGGKGWVKGKFMLTISEQEIETIAPKLLEKKVYAFLSEVFGNGS